MLNKNILNKNININININKILIRNVSLSVLDIKTKTNYVNGKTIRRRIIGNLILLNLQILNKKKFFF
jgi:hypothetical protein